MCCHILKSNGRVLQRSTVGRLTPAELANADVKKAMADFMTAIYNGPLGPSSTDSDFAGDSDSETPSYESYGDDSGDEPKMPEADTFTIDAFDKYIGAQLRMPLNDALVAHAKVVSRVKDGEGNPVGTSHSNPLQDNRVYEVAFADGSRAEYGANLIATAMFAQVDEEGRSHQIMDKIVNHRETEDSLSESEAYMTIRGKKHPTHTTRGWEMCILWKNGDTSWEKLKDVKEANPIKAAEYAVAKCIHESPAFNWWAQYTLKKRDFIISAVRARFIRRDYKSGIKVPANITEARALDLENGDDFWERSVEKEMKNVCVAFKVLEDGKRAPVGYQRILCMLIYDVKMDFTRKTRLIAGGHVTQPPSILTYASVVTRESVRIALLLAALNNMSVLGADISNAYLTAPTTEKVWTLLGAEWGPDAGKHAIIVCALYGLKTSGAAYRNHFASYLRSLGFTLCLAGPDVWL
jgi:hypothetical protein